MARRGLALGPGIEAGHEGVGNGGQGLAGEIGLLAGEEYVGVGEQLGVERVAQLVQAVVAKNEAFFVLLHIQAEVAELARIQGAQGGFGVEHAAAAGVRQQHAVLHFAQ